MLQWIFLCWLGETELTLALLLGNAEILITAVQNITSDITLQCF